MPEISVIIPILNSATTLERCLESVRSQTFHDWEALCVYDDSLDDSKKIIAKTVREDTRFVFVQGRNINLAAARNDGIKAATGKYIFFLDSDDALLPNAFERCYKEFLRRTCDIVVFGTEILPDIPRASDWYYRVLQTRNKFYRKFSEKALFLENSARPFVWRNAFLKDFLDENELFFDETCFVGEDQVFQLCAFPNVQNGISFIKEELYQYTWTRSGSLMAEFNKDILFRLRGHIHMVDSVFRYWAFRNYDNLSKADIAVWCIYFLGWEIPYLPKDKIDALAKPIDKLFLTWLVAALLNELPNTIRCIAINLQNHIALQPNRWRHLKELLCWERYWGGVWKAGRFLIFKIVRFVLRRSL
ncbi:glycosyltransferase family 2 protein [Treponema zioleckii]|uniref:glycosyltransferase family 2 protein n=1 Tax=Treponema zioleckii TaxID=331680 RepID=UPI00168A9909|nr:glycosyltransferase family 2 protein [Treponema zioleckii]